MHAIIMGVSCNQSTSKNLPGTVHCDKHFPAFFVPLSFKNRDFIISQLTCRKGSNL